MQVALTLPILIALFLVAMERLEARVFGPYADAQPAADLVTPDLVTPAGELVHLPEDDGNEADGDRQGPGGRIEGHGPWTHR